MKKTARAPTILLSVMMSTDDQENSPTMAKNTALSTGVLRALESSTR